MMPYIWQNGSRMRIRGQRGQALVETGMVVVILVVLFTGIVEFGRAWMVENMVSHALRDGARSAAITAASNRDSTGHINGSTKTSINTQILSEIQTVLGPSWSPSLQEITQTPADPIPAGVPPVVTAHITGSIPFIFGLFGSSVPLDRSVSFRDEGR